MCNICYHTPCPSACPNAEAVAVGTCAECGDLICLGEPYLRLGDGTLFHLDCLDALTVTALIEALGVDGEVIA